MVLTVTLNASMDKLYVVNDFKYDSINRVKTCKSLAGGKGINVSKVLNILGEENLATGIVGGFVGEYILDSLKKENIKNDFFKADGESRCCIHMTSNKNDGQTEILEPGLEVKAEEIEAFKEKYNSLLDMVSIVSISGSACNGFNKKIYYDLVDMANKKGKKVILDASGSLLREGIKAKPYAIKPNRYELQELVGESTNSIYEIKEAAESIREQGVKYVLVSCDIEGMYLFGEKSYKVYAPVVEVKNSVGSGDASVAGFIHAISNGLDEVEALKYAVACGSANAANETTAYFEKEYMEKLLEGLEVAEI